SNLPEARLILSLTPTALVGSAAPSKWVQRTCSQNDFRTNRRLLVESTSCAGIESNALRGPRGKPSLQFCIPYDTILVRPYKLSTTKGEQSWPTKYSTERNTRGYTLKRKSFTRKYAKSSKRTLAAPAPRSWD